MRPLSMWMSIYGQWGEAAPPPHSIPAGGQPAAGAAGGMAAGAPPLLLRGHHGQNPRAGGDAGVLGERSSHSRGASHQLIEETPVVDHQESVIAELRIQRLGCIVGRRSCTVSFQAIIP